MFRLLRQISFRHLRATWGRTLLVVGGVATGVSLIVAINVINTSVLANFRETIELMAGPAQLEVTLGIGEVGFPEETVDVVRTDPDVAAGVPLVRGSVSLADAPGEVLQMLGVDFTAEEDLERYHLTATRRGDTLAALADRHSVFLTERFAAKHGLQLGDRLRLSTPEGVDTFTVRGLLDAGGLGAAFGGNVALMDLPAAQLVLAKDRRIDQIDVVLRDGTDVRTAQTRLQALLPSTLSVARPEQRGEQYEGVLASFQAMLTGLSTLCLVAGIFIIYNTTSTGAIARARPIAELRLIGADRGTLFRLLMIESAILGFVGSALGVAIGIPLARLLAGTVTESMGVIFQLRFPVERLSIDPWLQVMIAAAGVVVALFASYFAAKRMTTMDPLDVVRTNAATLASSPPPAGLVRWWLVLVVVSIVAFGLEDHFASIAWGNFGSTLWNAAVIVIAIPIVELASRLLLRVLPRMFGAAGTVAAGSIARAPARAGVTVAAIALIVTIAIMLSSLVVSCRESLRSYFAGVLSADLVVSAVATEGGWLETPVPARIAGEIAALPGIRDVETGRVISGQVYRGQRIGLLALSDGMFEPARYPPGWYREGNAEEASAALRKGDAVAISTSLADRFDLHVGQHIDLETPTGLVALPIVGVVPDYVSDRGSVILNRRLLVARWGESTVSRVNVFVDPGVPLDVVRQRIIDQLGDRFRLKILTLRELLRYHTEMIDRAFAVMNAVQLLIVIVTVAGIFDLLLARIAERRRELSLWRLVGADERDVRRSIIVESGTIGVIGAAMGVAVGLVTAWLWIGIHFRQLLGYYVEYHFAVAATVWYVTLVIAMTMLAGYAAASRATRLPVLEGIQAE